MTRNRDYFVLIGRISNVEIIGMRHSVRDLARIRRKYGHGRWRKLKGVAL